MKRYVIYSFIGVLIGVFAACEDNLLNDEFGPIPKGETDVNASVEFIPLQAELDKQTRTAGNAIKEIDNLCVLLYGLDKKLVRSYYLLPEGTPQQENSGSFKVSDVKRTDSDADGGVEGPTPSKTAESTTKRAEFKLGGVPYGHYYIYVVANMGNLGTDNAYREQIGTVDKLKSINLTWKTDWTVQVEGSETDKTITKANANHQMFGWFTPENKNSGDTSPVTINKKGMKLHAWIRRAASKVTIAYDANGLEEGVFIYLKSVQIKDIPANCYLGKENKPGDTEQGALLQGEVIKYYTGDNVPAFDEKYPVRLAKGQPLYPLVTKTEGDVTTEVLNHDENADALFFYENMQGAGEEMPDKRQDADGDGVLDYPGLPDDKNDPGKPNNPGGKYPDYRYKDKVPYGTYIEVEAHYVSINSKKVGSGDIKYRFMLGKDVEKDYNAERNHHYKLTLKFKNFANDADWHIEYEEPEPGIEVPNPYYISYLYNHSMMLPLKINAGYSTLKSLSAEIIDNRWAPNAPNKTFDYYSKMDISNINADGTINGKGNVWNGFLSLRQTEKTVVTGGVPYTAQSNQAYYEGNGNSAKHRGKRTYEVTNGLHGSDDIGEDGSYTVQHKKGEGNIYNISIPMYTRAKQLIKGTGYTGNNPYVAYQRKAVVRIKAELEDGTSLQEDVTIYQVRRVVNPKGIWRRHDNSDPFHVVLKRLPMENATRFETFTSEGPWKAYVVRGYPDSDFVYLNSDLKATNDTVYGKTGSNIDFDINFQETCGANENRYAIIRVEYHNYSCYHLIFVRQGEAPDNLIENGTKWHAFNMITQKREATSPLDEGSLFKFGNWESPIDARNNKNPTSNGDYWINVTPSYFEDDRNTDFILASEDDKGLFTAKWKGIKQKDLNATDGIFKNTSFGDSGNENWKIASYQDFVDLYNGDEIEEGFGVLYGNDATETADDLNEVYGYDRWSVQTRGMRGCFVYNSETGKNLFFPIGASGYGHRKNENPSTEVGRSAVLRYSCTRYDKFPEGQYGDGKAYPHGVADAPLFHDLYMRPGAIYWLDEFVVTKDDVNEGNAIGWDFNYFTFDFFPITSMVRADACFIRCVDK